MHDFWIWLKEMFSFGNIGTIHVVEIEERKNE